MTSPSSLPLPPPNETPRTADVGLSFPLKLLAILAVIGLLLSTVLLPFYTWLHTQMSLATATVVEWLVSGFGESTRIGVNVTYGSFAVQIVGECLGLYEIFIFVACVLAYPASWAQRGQGLLLGTLLILAFNLVRIVALLLVGEHAPTLFDFFHLYFWQTTLVLLVGSAWFAWLHWIVRR